MKRRTMLLGGPAACLVAGAPAEGVGRPAGAGIERRLNGQPIRAIDLTHRLTRSFAFTPGRLTMEPVEGSGAKAGMLMNRLCIVEHTGTHLDAPRHFDAQGQSVGDLALADLFVPLAVIDIREKVAADRDARVAAEDIASWERRHGKLPPGACVAMLSGWDPLAEFGRYAQLTPAERRKSPGFSEEAAPLLTSRGVRGLAVDTMSLDPGGEMPGYPVHRRWLGEGNWGLEGVANLANVPPAGALLLVGAPPIEGATGTPVRLIAFY